MKKTLKEKLKDIIWVLYWGRGATPSKIGKVVDKLEALFTKEKDNWINLYYLDF